MSQSSSVIHPQPADHGGLDASTPKVLRTSPAQKAFVSKLLYNEIPTHALRDEVEKLVNAETARLAARVQKLTAENEQLQETIRQLRALPMNAVLDDDEME